MNSCWNYCWMQNNYHIMLILQPDWLICCCRLESIPHCSCQCVAQCLFKLKLWKNNFPALTKPDHGPDRGPDHGSDQGKNFKIQNSILKIWNWFCWANYMYTRETIVSCNMFYLIQVWYSFIPLIYNNKGKLS